MPPPPPEPPPVTDTLYDGMMTEDTTCRKLETPTQAPSLDSMPWIHITERDSRTTLFTTRDDRTLDNRGTSYDAQRWEHSQHHAHTNKVTIHWNEILGEMNDIHTPDIPVGSLLDPSRPQSPTSVTEFPSSHEEATDTEADWDIFADLANDLIVPIQCVARTIGVDGDKGKL